MDSSLKTQLLLLLLLCGSLTSAPPPESPCPGRFSYRQLGPASWTGELLVQPAEQGRQLLISLDRPATLEADCECLVTTRDNLSYSVSLTSDPLPLTVNLLVSFPEDQPAPRLAGITRGGLQTCRGRTRRADTWVTPDFNLYGTTKKRTTATPMSAQQWFTPAFGAVRPTTKTTTTTTTTEASTKPIKPQEPQSCGVPARRSALPLITSGQDTVRGQWPWHAALYRSGPKDPAPSYICGATLVSRRSIVTAAHCVTEFDTGKPVDPGSLVVYLGKYELNLRSEIGVQIKQVSRFVVHPEYNASSYYADLAVLVLSSRVEFSYYVLPVCLWDSSLVALSNIENRVGSIVGWGIDETGQPTADLQLATVPVVSQDTCRHNSEFFQRFTSELSFCAGYRNGTSPCNGDSGGGMVFSAPLPDGATRWSLRGVVSISQAIKNRNTCDTKHYIVFTDVAKCLSFVTGAIVD